MSDLYWAIAQLRHAYAHLASESVVKQKMFADGLIAPIIQKLEGIAADGEKPTAQDK
jgi:hypothetical protein